MSKMTCSRCGKEYNDDEMRAGHKRWPILCLACFLEVSGNRHDDEKPGQGEKE